MPDNFFQRWNHLLDSLKCAGSLGVDATSTTDSNVTAGVEIRFELMLLKPRNYPTRVRHWSA